MIRTPAAVDFSCPRHRSAVPRAALLAFAEPLRRFEVGGSTFAVKVIAGSAVAIICRSGLGRTAYPAGQPTSALRPGETMQASARA